MNRAFLGFFVLAAMCLGLSGCDLADVNTGPNGMTMVHDDFKGTSDYRSSAQTMNQDDYIISGITFQAHHVVQDSDKTSTDFLIVSLEKKDWCFISDMDQLTFLAGSDKLVLSADGDSSRDVLDSGRISETAAYDLSNDDESFFKRHNDAAVRVQIDSSKCELEGTVDMGPIGDFFHGFQNLSGTATTNAN
jgi:hypothetical protein